MIKNVNGIDVEMTIEEEESILAEWKRNEKRDRNDELLQDIKKIESTQDRALREAVLSGDKENLQQIEQKIAELRIALNPIE